MNDAGQTKAAVIAAVAVVLAALIGAAATVWVARGGGGGGGGGGGVMGPLEPGTDHHGYDIDAKFAPSAQRCSEMCSEKPDCKAATYVVSLKTCWLKNPVPPATGNFDMISAVKRSG